MNAKTVIQLHGQEAVGRQYVYSDRRDRRLVTITELVNDDEGVIAHADHNGFEVDILDFGNLVYKGEL